MTNYTITGWLAEKLNGSVILIEHRFFGESNPYPNLSVESFRVHNLQQSIDDYEYFLKNVHLPIPGGDQLGPDKAPWILFGGSYSGALASYTMYKYVIPWSFAVFDGALTLNSQKTRPVRGRLCFIGRGGSYRVRIQ